MTVFWHSWHGMAFNHTIKLAFKPGVSIQTEHGSWLVLRRELFWKSTILYWNHARICSNNTGRWWILLPWSISWQKLIYFMHRVLECGGKYLGSVQPSYFYFHWLQRGYFRFTGVIKIKSFLTFGFWKRNIHFLLLITKSSKIQCMEEYERENIRRTKRIIIFLRSICGKG